MFGCNTVCPKCRHEFQCCPSNRRSLHALSGGGLIGTQPQTSPSVPLAFVLPFPLAAAADPVDARPEAELERLTESVRELKASGWYHEGLSWQQSQELLKGTEPGTFLIRDSSDSRFLYALSVQTEQGPTSVRLHYVAGKFRLDSEPYLAPLMPLFDTVIALVAHYVRCTAAAKSATSMPSPGQVWVDANGCMFSRILLKRPLLRVDRLPTLQHIARLSVHKALEMNRCERGLIPAPTPYTQLELPTRLVDYLAEYPYSL